MNGIQKGSAQNAKPPFMHTDKMQQTRYNRAQRGSDTRFHMQTGDYPPKQRDQIIDCKEIYFIIIMVIADIDTEEIINIGIHNVGTVVDNSEAHDIIMIKAQIAANKGGQMNIIMR